jgi:MFS family permease
MTTSEITSDAGRRSATAALAVLLAGTFMAALDAAIANVAAPGIGADLHISGTMLVLALSGYTVSYAMLLITGARLGDDHGHRRLFLVGLVGFTAASLACGLASSGAFLIVARVVQGGACALMAPQVATVIQLEFEGAQRARALGLFATVLAIGVVAGQVLGGLLVSADLFGLGWRSVFLVNVPIGSALVLVGRRTLPFTKAPVRKPLDLLGVVICAAALLMILLPLLLGRQDGWPAWSFVSIAGGVALGAGAAVYFRRLSRRGGSPLVDPQILSDGRFALAVGSLFTSTAAWGGFLLPFTLYLQGGLGYSALGSGAAFVPYGVAFAITSLWRFPERIRPLVPPVGLAIAALGYLALGLVDQFAWHPLASELLLAVAGGGYGAGFSAMMTAAVASVPPERAHDASGMMSTALQVSYAVGLTALGSLFLGSSHGPHAGGHGFMVVSLALAGLALAAAGLAWLTGREPRTATRERLREPVAAQAATR